MVPVTGAAEGRANTYAEPGAGLVTLQAPFECCLASVWFSRH